jgi:acyl-CoA thioesterase-2
MLLSYGLDAHLLLNSESDMSHTLTDLLARLDLQQVEADVFSGTSPQSGVMRVFGGLVVSQALVAASRTVTGRPPHSLHSYFLLPGDPAKPIRYEVERLRDGGSFSARRCVAKQDERTIFILTASFQSEEGGFDYAPSMPDVPPPDTLPDLDGLKAALGDKLPEGVRRYLERDRPVDLRIIDLKRFAPRPAGTPPRTGQRIWMRAKGALPDDPAVHRAMLAYISDMTLLDVSLVPHDSSVFDGKVQAASLDHAIWFHRPFRANDWMLYDAEAQSTQGARGLCRGRLFSSSGHLIATTMQEGLIRPKAS